MVRYHLAWADAGPTVRDRTVAAGGFRQPQGVAFLERGPSRPLSQPHERGRGPKDDALVVSDSHENERTGRTDGTVVLIESDGERRTLIDGLPNGRHNTNRLAFGPDDRLYVTNGNATDDGCEGGLPEVPPYSGAVLAVDVDGLEDDPAVLRWFDGDGERIAPADVAEHPVNEDFNAKVDVVAPASGTSTASRSTATASCTRR